MADRLVVRTERRMGLIRVGGWLFLIGLVALIIGALATWLGTLGQAAFANDRVEIPGELTFDGDGGDYTLLLIENPVYATGYGNAVAQIICDVARPDGTTTEVDGSFALVRTETDLGVEIGRFSTTAGETVVDCRWSGTGGDREGYYASVAPAASWFSIASTALLIGGIALLLIAGALLYRGYRGRSVTERVPADDPPS